MLPLLDYLAQRPESGAFLLPASLERTLNEICQEPASLLPSPFKIFPADETLSPTLGFPVLDTPVMRELDAKLDRWVAEEVTWQVNRAGDREKAAAAFALYLNQLVKVAENAMISNVLSDYHGIFWLSHSFDLAKQFTSIPRRVSSVDTQAGRALGDTLKYRIYGRWVSETRDALTQVATRAANVLDGEEQRSLRFFRLLQDDVLVLTEEFISPDLRELRNYVNGYLKADFHAFRDAFERARQSAAALLQSDRSFRSVLPLFGVRPEQGITTALLLDSHFQNYLFEQPTVQNAVSREEREQLQLISRRLREFAVLNQLRRAITWMTVQSNGQIVSAEKRSNTVFSRSTRPMDFGRPGVVDPMVYRFGMIYDISSFTETLGSIRRGGEKEELRSYRQMFLFQRRLDAIASRYLLQFEKFLGDGAFYTTRRAARLVRAALEIQRFYGEMKRKGFAFNKGLRVALNFGYYRLLPMRSNSETGERITEFYGPGIVELSRLTTGKANKDIQEVASFLIAHGYNEANVRSFFAPLARGAGLVDREQEVRSYYAYIDPNGGLVNEGIVASGLLVQELSNELAQESAQLFRIRMPWGTCIGFEASVPEADYCVLRLLGRVALKGLDPVEVAEVAGVNAADAIEVTPIDGSDPLMLLLRQEFHTRQEEDARPAPARERTAEQAIQAEIIICLRSDSTDPEDEVLIGTWDPQTDEVQQPLRLPRGDFQRLFSLRGVLAVESLIGRQESVRDMYQRLSSKAPAADLPLAPYRERGYQAFLLGEEVVSL